MNSTGNRIAEVRPNLIRRLHPISGLDNATSKCRHVSDKDHWQINSMECCNFGQGAYDHINFDGFMRH